MNLEHIKTCTKFEKDIYFAQLECDEKFERGEDITELTNRIRQMETEYQKYILENNLTTLINQ